MQSGSSDLESDSRELISAEPGRYGEEAEISDLLTNLHLLNPTSDGAPMLRFGRFDDLPHQHLPLARLSASDWKGIMIADEVGLGKTISAIQILVTLQGRGESGATIVICPGGLRRKWCNELWHRADIEAVEIDSGVSFRHYVERIEAGEVMVLVVSQGILRRSPMLDWLVDHSPRTMLTIVDEAHHIRNPKSLLHSAVTMLSLSSERVVLLTATPVNLSTDDLFVQLSLLAPGRWPDAYAFSRSLRPGTILNNILDLLAAETPDLDAVDDLVMNLEHTVGFSGDARLEMLATMVREMEWREETIPDLRLAAADLVRRLRPLNGLVVRSRRRDLDWQQPSRRAITLDIRLVEEEWNLYVAARDWSHRLMELRRPDDDVWDWAMLVPERMASSSLQAYAGHVLGQMRDAARLALDLDQEPENDDDDMATTGDVTAVGLDRVEQRLLSRVGNPQALITAAENLGEVDSKFAALSLWLGESLREDEVGGVILFSHFRGTLAYLLGRLRADGFATDLITGSTNMGERERIRTSFANGDFDILLSSEVGSEGLDQQHCHRMVNYDLPWNPMRLEQRVGRIDRFGQMADEITVLNFAVEGTIDAAVLGRLYSRIKMFEQSLGMLDPLLGKAMRLIAREEMVKGRPILVDAEEVAADDPELIHGIALKKGMIANPEDGVETLLAMREKWHKERATETREWLGPDPGIDEVRQQTIDNGLHLEVDDLRRWVKSRLREIGGDIYDSEHVGCDLIELSRENVTELGDRCSQPGLADGRHADWQKVVLGLINSPSPYWLTVTFERDTARENPHRPHITPAHPLVRWLIDLSNGEQGVKWFIAPRPEQWQKTAEWLVCLDWQTDGLQRRQMRRWLLLDAYGIPLDNQPERPWSELEGMRAVSPEKHAEDTIEEAVDNLHAWLLQDERSRLQPILEELRWNTRSAWEGRIEREMQQIREATWRAEQRGEVVEHRWRRMKQGLIRRLQEELRQHLVELERLEHDLSADLVERLVIRLR